MSITWVTFYNINLFLINVYEIYKCFQINTKRISIGLIFKAHGDPQLCPETQTISRFRVHVCLLFKASLSVKFSFICKIEVITITKTLHLDSLWRGGRYERGNGPLDARPVLTFSSK